jgi:DNA-binding transcriptional LysR family regulator
MLNLNPHQLNVFLVAAETLNFTHAAQRLQVSQPSVSQHIQALEEHFGVPLFMRAGRSIELTDAGVALIPLARELVDLAIHIDETIASLKGDIYGHLVVGCSSSTGRYILPKLLAGFHQQYPQVRVTCHVSSCADVLEMLEEGKVHLALACNPPFCADVDFFQIASEQIVLITPPGHPWTNQSEIQLEELKEAEFIFPDEGTEYYSAIQDALAHAGISIYQLKTIITMGSLEAIALSVQEGLGVSFIPQLIISRLVKNSVEVVQINGFSIQREVFAGRNFHRPPTAAQEAFWNFLTNGVNQGIQPVGLVKKL